MVPPNPATHLLRLIVVVIIIIAEARSEPKAEIKVPVVVVPAAVVVMTAVMVATPMVAVMVPGERGCRKREGCRQKGSADRQIRGPAHLNFSCRTEVISGTGKYDAGSIRPGETSFEPTGGPA
jgi:hypothetical protein